MNNTKQISPEDSIDESNLDFSPSSVRKRYNDERIKNWDYVADQLGTLSKIRNYYHSRLQEVYKLSIPEGARILDLGCGNGDLLASLNSSFGIGVDFSGGMIELARTSHPELEFYQQDVQTLDLKEKFEYIILSDLVNDVEDVQTVFEIVKKIRFQILGSY